MSDLISRSELISRIESEYREYGEDYDTEQILGDIEDMPTAYDVDKVVEQLEEVEKIMTSPVTEDCFGEECRASDCTVCLISKAIEIVKGGGVDAKTDF